MILPARLQSQRIRRAFTLMEALMASAMLFAGVLAVITAIMGGQKKAIEAQRRMEAALIAEELMGDVAVKDYASLLSLQSPKLVAPFVARTDAVIVDEDLPGLGVRVHGIKVHVRIMPDFDNNGLPLAEAELFIPEPPS